ncbi:copper-binding protein [Thermosporothrix hazakensis]|nr:copper-binding protein [Thermosporothrix hazakensis]
MIEKGIMHYRNSGALGRLQKVFWVVSLAVLLTFFLPQRASAHAQYVRSNPPKDATLQSGKAPASVQVWFSEEVEPDFSKLEVYNQQRQQIDLKDSHVTYGDPKSMQISLPPDLPDGPYTVVFRNVSREDGHSNVGSFSFLVGKGTLPTDTSALISKLQPVENFNGWSISIRWLNYLGVAGLVGSLAFLLLVWRPVAAQLFAREAISSGLNDIGAGIEKYVYRVILGSLGVLILGWLMFLFYQTYVVGGGDFFQQLSSGSWRSLLLSSRFGSIWLLRLGLIVLALFLGLSLRYTGRKISDSLLSWILLLAGLGIVITTSLNSHSSGTAMPWLSLPSDMLHFGATSFWIGGLLVLLLTILVAWRVLKPGTGDRTRFLAILIPRFSVIAGICVAVLVTTGSVQAYFLLGSFAAFLNNAYGVTLTIKLAVFVGILVLAAFHLLRISPLMKRFAQSNDEEQGASSLVAGRTQRAFRRSLRGELLFAVALLGVVGVLTSLSPPPQGGSGSGSIEHTGTAGDISYKMVITPGMVGSNTFGLYLKDASGKPVEKAENVIARFTMLDMDMGVLDVKLEPVAETPGLYRATDNVISMSGDWQATLIIMRPDVDDVRASFKFVVK